MHAASRAALRTLHERLEGVTSRFSTPEGMTNLAEELYAVVDLLIAQPQLRRLLSDPTTPPEGRAQLAARLFDGKVGASTLQILRDAVALRWSSPFDLLDALETSADDVLFAAAEQAGELDEVEDELFRFERVLDANSRLTTTLDDAAAQPERRVALLRGLLEDKVRPITLRLLEHAVASRRKHTVTLALDDLLQLAAARRNRSIARVISAVELTRDQHNRLAEALTELYGRPIDIRAAVDPAVRGGLVVRVGDEVIDGSIAARLTEARAGLAG
ncbi:MAG: F-type H+-transporting ATPase subunit delta [Pseudonocardiales bacterium]|jgi:F-type H+-transporting ATPase subunit delta|nr:synthase subunit delta [Pseudonocardiales bacterium]MDT4978469.1 F-type H+-transporting ATPase subunit delta [Pseudonocardiales bacterium]